MGVNYSIAVVINTYVIKEINLTLKIGKMLRKPSAKSFAVSSTN